MKTALIKPFSDSLSSKETSNTQPSQVFQSEIYVNIQNQEASNTSDIQEMRTTEKAPEVPSTQGNENSTEGNCENETKTLVTRLAPEGAESSTVDVQMSDSGNTAGSLAVPDKRVTVVSEAQRRDFVGSPSGLMDIRDDWMWDEDIEG